MADAIGAPFTAIFGEDVDPDYLAWVSATVPQYKQKVLAAYPNWEHPFLVDWEIRYFAARPIS